MHMRVADVGQAGCQSQHNNTQPQAINGLQADQSPINAGQSSCAELESMGASRTCSVLAMNYNYIYNRY